MYLLSDSDMHKLGYLEKQNPHNQKFANMKQYLTSQVCWGGGWSVDPAHRLLAG